MENNKGDPDNKTESFSLCRYEKRASSLHLGATFSLRVIFNQGYLFTCLIYTQESRQGEQKSQALLAHRPSRQPLSQVAPPHPVRLQAHAGAART